jgi:hypothetical protein
MRSCCGNLPKAVGLVFRQIYVCGKFCSTVTTMVTLGDKELLNELAAKGAATYKASHWMKYRVEFLRSACAKCNVDLSCTPKKAQVAEAIVHWVRGLDLREITYDVLLSF